MVLLPPLFFTYIQTCSIPPRLFLIAGFPLSFHFISYSILSILNLYLPFPQPDTGSITPECTSLDKSLEALEFRSSKSATISLLPNISSYPNTSNSFRICEAVLEENSFAFSSSANSMSTFSLSDFLISSSVFVTAFT